FLFPFYSSRLHRCLLSFPTRRSSDLGVLAVLDVAELPDNHDYLRLVNRKLGVSSGHLHAPIKLCSKLPKRVGHRFGIRWVDRMADRKSTPSELQSRSDLVCRLLLEKK